MLAGGRGLAGVGAGAGQRAGPRGGLRVPGHTHVAAEVLPQLQQVLGVGGAGGKGAGWGRAHGVQVGGGSRRLCSLMAAGRVQSYVWSIARWPGQCAVLVPLQSCGCECVWSEGKEEEP